MKRFWCKREFHIVPKTMCAIVSAWMRLHFSPLENLVSHYEPKSARIIAELRGTCSLYDIHTPFQLRTHCSDRITPFNVNQLKESCIGMTIFGLDWAAFSLSFSLYLLHPLSD